LRSRYRSQLSIRVFDSLNEYFDANILERIYYFFDPQKLFQDAEEENLYSYTREEYQNSKR